MENAPVRPSPRNIREVRQPSITQLAEALAVIRDQMLFELAHTAVQENADEHGEIGPTELIEHAEALFNDCPIEEAWVIERLVNLVDASLDGRSFILSRPTLA